MSAMPRAGGGMTAPRVPPVRFNPQQARVMRLALAVGWQPPRPAPRGWGRRCGRGLVRGLGVALLAFGLLWLLVWVGLPCP